MERRQEPRRARRLKVSYWRPGTEQRFTGFSTNISATGIFIATHQPLPPGQRLRLELSAGESGFMAEGVVARAVRSPQTLQSVIASGMGVRFLTIKELVGELFPPVAGPVRRRPEAPNDSVYEVRFADRRQLLEAYHRDIRTGGLFVPTQKPAALGERVTIQLVVGEPGAGLVRLEARVVHSFDSGMRGNLLAGMGVELVDPETDLERIRALLDQVPR